MKYKFDIWWKDSKKNYGVKGLHYIEAIEVEAESYKDALEAVAQAATDHTEISPCE